MCMCNPGFTGNGSECSGKPPTIQLELQTLQRAFADINECSNSTLNDCHVYATCINSVGNYSCECMQGFDGDGLDCQGIFIHIICQKNATFGLVMFQFHRH